MKKRLIFSKRFFLLFFVVLVFTIFTFLMIRFYIGKRSAEKLWNEQKTTFSKIPNLGSTKTLEIIPLTDWFLSDDSLEREASVSYLIKTDTTTILFDVGLNRENADPSPLLQNMAQLGISMDDFNTIFISHNHPDHVGGVKWMASKTFSLTNQQIELSGKKVYTPLPMTYPGLKPTLTEHPTKIAEGVATTGIIVTQLFFLGSEPEQALAINVEGKGIVLIIGCGHQTITKLLQRVDQLFDEPIFGIVGGLHYAATDSRGIVAGIGIQRYVGTGKLPWQPITIEYVHNDIELISKRSPKIIRLSGHDSCDVSLNAFRDAFPSIFQTIKVGEKIKIIGNQI